MKKSLIALAVAGVMAAPVVAQADATLYGKFEMRLKSVSDQDLEVESDDFRVGIKGDADIGMGDTKAIFQYETEINPEDSSSESAFNDNAGENTIAQRLAYVGATGSWGTAMIGRFGNPSEAIYGYTGNLSEGNLADWNPDRLGAAIGYKSPSMGGLDFYAIMVAEGQSDDTEEDVDGYVVGANYGIGGLNLSAAYWEIASDYVNNAEDTQYYAVGGEYALGATKLGVSYQNLDENSSESDVWGVRLTHSIDALTLLANYHEADDASWDYEYSVAAAYSLGKQASLDAEFVSQEMVSGSNTDIFSVGYTVKF